MSFIRHSNRDAEEDFEYAYQPPRSHQRHRPRRESGNNQEEDEQTNTTDTVKTRSLSLCPSTLAASQAWQQWRESLRDEPRSRSKSLFVGEIGLSPCDEDFCKAYCEEDNGEEYEEDKEEERTSTSLLHALSPQKTSLALKTLRPRWASASGETVRKASPLSPRESEHTVDAKRMSLREPLRVDHEKEEEEGEEERVVRLIPLRALLNFNRDLSGVRLSRAARIRRDNPTLPTSPTDRLEPSPQQRLRSRRATAELQTAKGAMIAQC